VPRPFARFSRRNGNAIPPKFEPPPTQPITISGYSPDISICFRASSPITVWCMRTWFRTLPNEYFASPVRRGVLDGLAYGYSQGTRGVRALFEDVAARLREVRGAGVDRRTVGLHHDAP